MAIYNGGLNIIAPDISGKEDKSNKVTAWSSTTTDAHYPSEKLVKGALDTKVNTANVLTYEEIMDSTDLSGKVASASVLKTLSDNLSGFTVLKTFHAYGVNFNLDDLSNYPEGQGLLNYSLFSSDTTGTKPFPDGHLLTFIWNNIEGAPNRYLTQIAFEDDRYVMEYRYYSQTAWSDWKKIWMEGDMITGAVFN